MAYVQLRDLREIRTGDLTGPLKLSPRQERDLLSRMSGRGLIARVRRGLYLVPAKLPLGGQWTPDEATAINALMDDRGARYQITGPSAFSRYGWDEQIPAQTTLYNDAISGQRRIGQIRLSLIAVGQDRLGDVEQIQTPSGLGLVYSSRVRALVDAVYDWSRFDSLPRAYDWIRSDIESGLVKPMDVARTAVRFGNMGTIRRIGAFLEQRGADDSVLDVLARKLTKTTAKIPLIPGRPNRGSLLKRWAVVLNG